MELRKVLPSPVQGWINRMMDDEVGPNTIHVRFKVLRTCLAARKGVSARRDRLIQYNPRGGTQLPVIPEREVTILEPDQVDKILLAHNPWWRLLPLLDDLAQRIIDFQNRYNHTAEPFGWNYTRDDLNRYLDPLNDDGSLRAAA